MLYITITKDIDIGKINSEALVHDLDNQGFYVKYPFESKATSILLESSPFFGGGKDRFSPYQIFSKFYICAFEKKIKAKLGLSLFIQFIFLYFIILFSYNTIDRDFFEKIIYSFFLALAIIIFEFSLFYYIIKTRFLNIIKN